MNMFPPHNQHDAGPDRLREALSQLPEHAPDSETWSRIHARAVSRRRSRRRLRRILPLAAAASLLLALGMPVLHDATSPDRAPLQTQTHVSPPTRNPATAHTAMPTVASLQHRSMRMEQWLSELRTHGAPLQGVALARAVDLQDRIGLVDLQLSAPGDTPARKALWQQRVNLLQDLAMLRVSQSPVSDQRAMAESRSAAIQL